MVGNLCRVKITNIKRKRLSHWLRQPLFFILTYNFIKVSAPLKFAHLKFTEILTLKSITQLISAK
jgi:hypothetical protein